MTTGQRLDLIARYIREHKYADLHMLATRCDVTTAARPWSRPTSASGSISVAFHWREAAEKHAVGRYIADLVQPGMTIIMDGGTTVEVVARLLVTKRHGKARPDHVQARHGLTRGQALR